MSLRKLANYFVEWPAPDKPGPSANTEPVNTLSVVTQNEPSSNIPSVPPALPSNGSGDTPSATTVSSPPAELPGINPVECKLWWRLLYDHHTRNIGFGVLLGLVIVPLFGFCPQLVDPYLRGYGWKPNAVKSWELGAILWNGLFAFMAYWEIPKLGEEKGALDNLIRFLLVLVLGFSGLAIRCLFGWHWYLNHMHFVLAVSLILLITDLLLAYHLEIETQHQLKKEFYDIFVMLDVPMAVAVCIIAFYQYFQAENPEMEAFLGGAVSFGLLAQNAIFVILHWKVFPVRERASENSLDSQAARIKNLEKEIMKLNKKLTQSSSQLEEVKKAFKDKTKDLHSGP